MRIIARLDVKAPNIVKGVNFEGLRKMGDPSEFARRYYEENIDEILFIDIVASLYGRNSLLDIISRTTSEVFVPITVGGGIRTIKDIREILRAGADKVAINTAAIKDPEFIYRAASEFGSQCIVGSIHAKKKSDNNWEAYFDSGREKSGKNAICWTEELVKNGAGEILISSVDKDGTLSGPDFDLLQEIQCKINVPTIASSGISTANDIFQLYKMNFSAVAIGSALHYKNVKLKKLKKI